MSTVGPAPLPLAPTSTPANTTEAHLTVSENYGKLPLSFEPNMGQSAKGVKFLSRGSGYNVFLAATEAVFSLRPVRKEVSRAVLRMKLAGANQNATVEGQQPLPGKVNYRGDVAEQYEQCRQWSRRYRVQFRQ